MTDAFYHKLVLVALDSFATQAHDSDPKFWTKNKSIRNRYICATAETLRRLPAKLVRRLTKKPRPGLAV